MKKKYKFLQKEKKCDLPALKTMLTSTQSITKSSYQFNATIKLTIYAYIVSVTMVTLVQFRH
jgi:hypothetical protein